MSRVKAVEVEDFTFSYGGRGPVLEHFGMSVEAGEWAALTGRSGCGKSTLLHCICGLAQRLEGTKSSGQIRLFGEALESYPRRRLAGVLGMVFQNTPNRLVCPTVEEEIWFGLQNLCLEPEVIRERADQVMERFGLEKVRKENPSCLSGGQQQMTALAAVAAMEPRLYLLDEVMCQLDRDNRETALREIRRLREDGAAVLMVEHSREISAQADRRIILGVGI